MTNVAQLVRGGVAQVERGGVAERGGSVEAERGGGVVERDGEARPHLGADNGADGLQKQQRPVGRGGL